MRRLIIAEIYIHTYLQFSLSQSLQLSHISERLWKKIFLVMMEMMVVLWNSL